MDPRANLSDEFDLSEGALADPQIEKQLFAQFDAMALRDPPVDEDEMKQYVLQATYDGTWLCKWPSAHARLSSLGSFHLFLGFSFLLQICKDC